MRRSLFVSVAFCVAVATSSIGSAAESATSSAEQKSLLDSVSIGSTWYGPALTNEDLKGHVVLVEFWGRHCGPCLASMPHLVKLQDELRDTGFTIIGAHSQDGTQDEVVNVARGLKVNYTITNSASIPGESVSGLPAAFLFDSSGKMVAKGLPMELGKQITDLVASEPHFLAAGRKYTKHKAEADLLKKSKSYGPILKKLDKDVNGSGDAADEAKYLTKRIRDYGVKKLADAKTAEGSDAFLAQQGYNEIATNWKGDELGDKASARLKELKSDKDFQTELKASTMAHQILAECDKLIAQGGTINLEYALNQKIAASVKGGATALKKKYPDAKATIALPQILMTYGFKGI